MKKVPVQRAGGDGDQRPEGRLPPPVTENVPTASVAICALLMNHKGPLAPDLAVPLGERDVVDGADLHSRDPGETRRRRLNGHANPFLGCDAQPG